MNPIVKFAKEFIDAEYNITISRHSEQDNIDFEKKKENLQKFFAFDIKGNFRRPKNPNKDFFNLGKTIIDSTIPRPLFQIKAYRHPDFERLYRIYTGFNIRPHPEKTYYHSNFYVSDTKDDIKIVSWYDLQNIPKGISLIKDHGLTWMWIGGERLSTLGELIEVHKIAPPDDPAHRAEYDAE